MSNGPDNSFEQAQDPSIKRLVNMVILEAAKRSASRVQLQPDIGVVHVRVTSADGSVEEAQYPDDVHCAVITRLRLMSGIPAGGDEPQHAGMVWMKVKGQEMQLQTSFSPHALGEAATIDFTYEQH